MNASCMSPAYEEGVEQFLEFASERSRLDEDEKYFCPFINCLNGRRQAHKCQVKKILCPMGMKYQKIHACPNDCILYRYEFEEMHKCLRCGVSWHKVKDDNECNSVKSTKKGPPAKVLWYLLIIPRFKHLFANGDDTKDLTWHADERNCDGMVCHPTNSS